MLALEMLQAPPQLQIASSVAAETAAEDLLLQGDSLEDQQLEASNAAIACYMRPPPLLLPSITYTIEAPLVQDAAIAAANAAVRAGSEVQTARFFAVRNIVARTLSSAASRGHADGYVL